MPLPYTRPPFHYGLRALKQEEDKFESLKFSLRFVQVDLTFDVPPVHPLSIPSRATHSLKQEEDKFKRLKIHHLIKQAFSYRTLQHQRVRVFAPTRCTLP